MDDEAIERRATDTPVVSLVVPMYNVQQYLADCLDSILSQDLSPIQVILVDDGSTDGTAAVARRYAEERLCIEYHRIDNQGLGHARNYGATFARGTWLMFPDSDDELAPHALRDLVALGERHDCDIVTGDVDRFDSTREWPNPLHRTAFRGVPEVCHITTSPSLLYDHTAWNKLFRREFFERERLSWVEGRLYEDMPCSTPAHCLAGSVAHLDQVVYRWRERDGGGPSITQRRTEPANFRDRMHAIRLVDEFFEDHELPDVLCLAKDAKWLTLDIPIYLDVLPEGNEAYRREVVDAVASYLGRVDPRAWGMAPSAERIKCRLAQRRDVDGLVRFVRWQREAGDTLRVTRKRGRLYGSYPATGLGDPDRDMTAELARDGLYTDVKRVELEGGSLRIDASALVPRLSQRRPSLAARLVRADGKAALDLDVEGASSSRPLEVRVSAAHRSVAARWQPRRDWVLRASAESLATLPPGDYRVELSWSDAGLACDPTRLAHPLTGHGPRPYPVRSGESVLVVAYGPGEELTLRVLEDRSPVTRVAFDGDA
ncbi:MAG: glycosyltransferase family 2 protein, partial [Atopobiaceae bacterium]|nr:glycosyltransferase family 2 protein [Atopobiaceae bacterium]